MTSFGSQMTGTFVSTGTPFSISLPPGYDEFSMVNVSSIGSTAADSRVMRAYGSSAMPAGYGYYNPKTSGAATLALETTITSGGFTVVPDSARAALGPSVAITAVSQAAPALVSTGSTLNLVADTSVVRMVNVAGMQQISSVDFTIGSIVSNTSFTLKYMDTGAENGFNAAGTTGFYRIVPFPYQNFFPKRKTIADMTGTVDDTHGNIIVTFTTLHQYVVGEYVRLIVPNGFGATALNGQLAKIIATGALDENNFTNTVTLDLTWEATGALGWGWPTTQTALTVAQTVDVAETATILTQAEVNNSFTGVLIGGTVQTSGETYQWFAKKGDNVGLVTTL